MSSTGIIGKVIKSCVYFWMCQGVISLAVKFLHLMSSTEIEDEMKEDLMEEVMTKQDLMKAKADIDEISMSPKSAESVHESKKWSDLDTKKLIALYEGQEILWNVELREYRNRLKKHESLREISRKLKCSVTEVQRKLHNLRSQFNSEMKKVKQKSSGQATDEVYISNWPYFAAMKFINVKKPTTCSTVAKKNNSSKSKPAIVVECEDEEIGQSSTSMTQLQGEAETEILTPQTKKKTFKPSPDIPLYVQQAVRQLNSTNDEEQVFGDFCASELRLLKNPANKRIFKKIVMETISNIGEAEALGLVYTPYHRSLDVNFSVPSTMPSPSPGSSEHSCCFTLRHQGQPTSTIQLEEQISPTQEFTHETIMLQQNTYNGNN